MNATPATHNATRPMHEVGEEARFETDFYAYLTQPENASRYSPTVAYATERYGTTDCHILDLGCGSAPLAMLLPSGVKYTGVDHSEGAIRRCKTAFPQHRFLQADVENAIRSLAQARERFQLVILCGVLSHMVDKNDLSQKDDGHIVRECLSSLLTDDGCLSIVVGVPFRDDPRFGLYRQAEWKQAIVDRALSGLQVRRVAQALTVQVGLEQKIRAQKVMPDWFIRAPGDASGNRHTGEYIGALTVMVENRETQERV